MGRRSRSRAQAAGTPRPPRERPAGERPAAGGLGALGPVRRTLALYLLGAMIVAVLTLAGIIVLGGTLGPFITLAVAVLAGGLIHRAARSRLVGATMGDEDRVMQTLAGGLLLISVVLAAAGAVVATVS